MNSGGPYGIYSPDLQSCTSFKQTDGQLEDQLHPCIVLLVPALGFYCGGWEKCNHVSKYICTHSHILYILYSHKIFSQHTLETPHSHTHRRTRTYTQTQIHAKNNTSDTPVGNILHSSLLIHTCWLTCVSLC